MASTSNAAKALRELNVMVATVRQRMDSLEGRQRKQFWSAEEEQLLRDRYADELTEVLAGELGRSVSKVLAKANKMGLHKSEAFLAEHGQRLSGMQGQSSRFQKGHTTWNKGMKGLSLGGVDTQFCKGNMPHNWVPVGTEQIRDGYLWRKVTDTRHRSDWKQVHVMLWEQHNGPVPKGLILCFKDGNKQHIALANLELRTRAEHMQKNTIHRYPQELKDAIRTVAKLKRTIREVEHDEEQN
ncbi:HNH endonuclease [Pseudomonas chengduensis]|nr:HNH endonuclease signature motif containing protein [Pseudomonas chengduensis]MDH1281012.1 HNH endonuclease [Pseudomonas chengduensis]